ncbi:hypothetical protein Avbf_17400, partial [Armadillidium vulgare]
MEEKVFAVHKINEEFKYGEVSFFSNQLFFFSLNSSQVPKRLFSLYGCETMFEFKEFLDIHQN